MKRFGTPRGAFFLFLAVCCVVLACYIMRLEAKRNQPEDYDKLTPVQEVLIRDLTTNYPQTPKEVVKYYSEISMCFYNEEYTDEELEQLAAKAMELYDHELAENNPQEQYVENLKQEINAFKLKKCTISSYTTSSSTDVYDFTQDGYQFSRLYCTYHVRVGTALESIEEVFLLRMDTEGHWKIYGWDAAKNYKLTEG